MFEALDLTELACETRIVLVFRYSKSNRTSRVKALFHAYQTARILHVLVTCVSAVRLAVALLHDAHALDAVLTVKKTALSDTGAALWMWDKGKAKERKG